MKALMTTLVFLFYSHFGYTLPEFKGLVAGAVMQESLPYKGVDTSYAPSILILGHIGKLSIEGSRLNYSLKQLNWGALSALGQLRTHQHLEASDSPLTERDRDRSLELGAQLSIPIRQGISGRLSVLQDISAKHKGQEYEASAYMGTNLGPVKLLMILALQYQSKKLLDYYVGTDHYQPKADLTYGLELLFTLPFADDWAFTALGRLYQHGNQFSDSPLTDNDQTHLISLSVGYYF
jgi:outer membrane scaffolding protein for murein synthesis (MipA/OmpV family)